jgi:hypothetical protein
VEIIEAQFEPKDAAITVGESADNYSLDCEPCTEPKVAAEGVAGLDVALGIDLLNAVLDAIADREDARRYLQGLEADLRGRCDGPEQRAQVTAIVLAVKEAPERK